MNGKKKIDFNSKINLLLKNVDANHKKYYSINTFFGPSLFFHKKALIKSGNQLEYIYAVLTSWGMHRMGKGGAKMTDFKTFSKSIVSIQKELKQLKNKKLENLEEKDFNILEKIFKKIKVMQSKTKIVGNSKVMAHLLPNIVPPIDREYTFFFLKGSKYINNDIDKEWIIFKKFLQEFFMKVANNEDFQKKSANWIKNKDYPWDTSVPKIIDNLIIGIVKSMNF